MRSHVRTTFGTWVGVLVLLGATAGCSDDTEPLADPSASPAVTASPAADAPANGEPTLVRIGVADSDLGEVLTDADTGQTLYAFDGDDRSTSTCTDACLDEWRPLVGDSAQFLSGVRITNQVPERECTPATSSCLFDRGDGTRQVQIRSMPLYTYTGDQAEGETNGHGIDGSWWAVDSEGRVIDGGE